MNMDVAAAQVRIAHAHAQGVFQAQGRATGKKRQGVFVAQNHRRKVQTEVVHKTRFQQAQGQMPAAPQSM